MAELVPSVSHRDRLSGLGYGPPGEHFEPVGPGKPIGIQAKIERKFGVYTDQPRRSHWCGDDPSVEAVGKSGIGIFEGKVKGHRTFGSQKRAGDRS